MNKNVIVRFLAELRWRDVNPDAAADELIDRLNAAEAVAAVDKKHELEKLAQAFVDDYFEINGEVEEWRLASIELACLIRPTWWGTVKVPAGLSEDKLEEFVRDLWETWEMADFTDEDPYYYERGTCSAEYI